MGPLLTLGKQLGHHVLTACLSLLRLAHQAAVRRFQSLCLKQGKMFSGKMFEYQTKLPAWGCPLGAYLWGYILQAGDGLTGSHRDNSEPNEGAPRAT